MVHGTCLITAVTGELSYKQRDFQNADNATVVLENLKHNGPTTFLSRWMWLERSGQQTQLWRWEVSDANPHSLLHQCEEAFLDHSCDLAPKQKLVNDVGNLHYIRGNSGWMHFENLVYGGSNRARCHQQSFSVGIKCYFMPTYFLTLRSTEPVRWNKIL